MAQEHEAGCRPGDRLPDLTLPLLDGGEAHWRSPAEGSLVLMFARAPLTPSGRAYLDHLAEAAPDFADWDGRLLVVFGATPHEDETAPGAGQAWPFQLSLDQDGVARRRCGIVDGQAAVVIADRWGEVYFVARENDEAALPEPAAIEEWLRFLATQCPECGVPDESGAGEWAA